MAIAQRLDHYGTRHPRQTFVFGIAAGAAIVAGIVLAAALTIATDGSGPRVAVSSGAVITNEQALVAEQDYRAANSIGSTRSLAGVASLTPELTAGMSDLVPGHRFASANLVPVDTTLTPELSAGMADLVPGYPFTWVTPELRAGIEG